MVHELTSQPWRGVYLSYQLITTIFFRLPFWVLRNVPRSLRPRPSWSLKKTLMIKLIKHLSAISSRTDSLKRPLTDHTNVAQGPDIKYVWLNPTPDLLNTELRKWAAAANVAPVSIPGYWLDAPGEDVPINTPPHPGERVLYSLHGGSYIHYSASPHDMLSNIPRGILEHSKATGLRRALTLEYRLSRGAPHPPANAFPAALLDAIAGYAYLTQVVGFAPEDIVVAGDSAGGNLAIALVRYLIENVGMVGLPPPPGRLILLSPWADPSRTDDQCTTRSRANGTIDFLGSPGSPMGQYSRRALVGPLADGLLNRYVSPASVSPNAPSVSFKDFPPSVVLAGGVERIIDDIDELVKRMKRDMGADKVLYHVEPDAVHDYTVFKFFEPERTSTLRAISKWLRS
ncbi:Alpha/Beta hydrolase protein [Gloeopeniophorella convolvens]|nr:Alpha/Beta hydrolase protein [Gloeopeniophorella convolvens]